MAAFLLSTISTPDTTTVEGALRVHVEAIQTGDRAGLLSVWDEANAHISSLESGQVKTVRVPQAIEAWAAAPALETSWELQAVSTLNNEIATAQVLLHWRGATDAEFLTLVRQHSAGTVAATSTVADGTR